MVDINEGIKDVTKGLDDLISTGEERDTALTDRLKIDMTSRFWLAQNIRPIIALVLLTMQIGLMIALIFGVVIPIEVWIEVGGLNGAAIGFYFNSRKQEKIQMTQAKTQALKAEAAIEIKKIETKEEFRKEKAEEKRQKRLDREKKRKERKANVEP